MTLWGMYILIPKKKPEFHHERRLTFGPGICDKMDIIRAKIAEKKEALEKQPGSSEDLAAPQKGIQIFKHYRF